MIVLTWHKMSGRGICSHFCIQSDGSNSSVSPCPQSSPYYPQYVNGTPASCNLRRKFFINISQSLFWLVTNISMLLRLPQKRCKLSHIKQKGVLPPTLLNNMTWNHLFLLEQKASNSEILAENSELFEISKTMTVKTVTVHNFLNDSTFFYIQAYKIKKKRADTQRVLHSCRYVEQGMSTIWSYI